MWLVTQHGFFNIVESDDDGDKGLLTVKARRREDLLEFQYLMSAGRFPIEESSAADYRFRIKAPRPLIEKAVGRMAELVDYPKFKPRAQEKHPDRSAIYFRVWNTLCSLQREH